MASEKRQQVALVLGAGWSAAAGYPLARELLQGPIHVTSEQSRRRAQAVLDAFRSWATHNDPAYAEVFLAEVQRGRVPRPPVPEEPTLFDGLGGLPLPWSWAVETVMLRLSWPQLDRDDLHSEDAVLLPPRARHKVRYRGDLASPARSRPHEVFLREVLAEHDLVGVVTTNYDTLAERTLRHRPMRRHPEPGFFYAGLPTPQRAKGSSPWDRYNEDDWVPGMNSISITGRIPLCKLHGSLSWKRTGAELEVYRDLRLPFRDGGAAAIVAPVPEKEAEPWLEPVWSIAENVLSRAEKWIIVGYSLPPYDIAARALFQRSARAGRVGAISLHDPFAEQVASNWHDSTGLDVSCQGALARTPFARTRYRPFGVSPRPEFEHSYLAERDLPDASDHR